MSNQSSRTSSFPLLGILGIVFVTLKLTGVIGWSWWWVTAPFWGPFAIVFLIGVPVFAIIAAMNAKDDKPNVRSLR